MFSGCLCLVFFEGNSLPTLKPHRHQTTPECEGLGSLPVCYRSLCEDRLAYVSKNDCIFTSKIKSIKLESLKIFYYYYVHPISILQCSVWWLIILWPSIATWRQGWCTETHTNTNYQRVSIFHRNFGGFSSLELSLTCFLCKRSVS